MIGKSRAPRLLDAGVDGGEQRPHQPVDRPWIGIRINSTCCTDYSLHQRGRRAEVDIRAHPGIRPAPFTACGAKPMGEPLRQPTFDAAGGDGDDLGGIGLSSGSLSTSASPATSASLRWARCRCIAIYSPDSCRNALSIGADHTAGLRRSAGRQFSERRWRHRPGVHRSHRTDRRSPRRDGVDQSSYRPRRKGGIRGTSAIGTKPATMISQCHQARPSTWTLLIPIQKPQVRMVSHWVRH